MRIFNRFTTLATALLLAFGASAQAAPFTYHGTLSDGGQPANGRYDLQVALYATEQSAAPLLPAVALFGVEVHDGSFSTEVDLGTVAQDGGWIGVAVRPAGSSEFAVLSGRSKVEPAGTCPAAWSLDGNAGTTAANYLGTSDANDVVFKAGGLDAGRFQAAPNGPSFVAGPGHANAARAVSLNFGYADAIDSLAAGYSGVVMPGHDESFVWGDHLTPSFPTTGPRQFLIRAGGGVGINTNTFLTADDLVIYPRSEGDADSDLSFVTRGGVNQGRIFVRDSTGIMFIGATHGVHITNPVAIDGAIDAKALTIEGSATKSTAGAWAANSDARIKQDIEPIADALATLQKIQPVTFRYADAYRADHAGVADQRYYNVIAQQFAQVFPDAVKGSGEYLAGAAKTADNEILQVDTYPAQIVTIAAVQELAQKNAALLAMVDRLGARLATLEAAQGK